MELDHEQTPDCKPKDQVFQRRIQRREANDNFFVNRLGCHRNGADPPFCFQDGQINADLNEELDRRAREGL